MLAVVAVPEVKMIKHELAESFESFEYCVCPDKYYGSSEGSQMDLNLIFKVWGSYQHYNYSVRVDRSEMKQKI